MLRQLVFTTLLIASQFIGSQYITSQANAADDVNNANDANKEAPLSNASSAQAKQLPLNELRNFTEIFDRIRNSYVEPVDDKTLLQYAIDGMLSNLDPHSDYLLPEDFSDLQEHTTGKFGGLGIEVSVEDGLIKVVTPIDETPAQKAGIEPGDYIISIDGKPVREMPLNDAIGKMRGEPGTKIDLTIRRKDEPSKSYYE